MNSERGGFTLIELLVVVLILGVLASLGTPVYMKTVESARATDSVGLAQMVANAERMCILDHPSDSAAACPAQQLSNSHPLVTNKYLAGADWANSYYSFYSCNTSCSACGAGSGYACSKRKSGRYAAWGYNIDTNGACQRLAADAPACPNL